MTEQKHFFTTGEIAKILNVRIHQIAYAVAAQHVEDASLEFMHKKMWSESDVDRLRKYFAQKKKQKEDRENEVQT